MERVEHRNDAGVAIACAVEPGGGGCRCDPFCGCGCYGADPWGDACRNFSNAVLLASKRGDRPHPVSPLTLNRIPNGGRESIEDQP